VDELINPVNGAWDEELIRQIFWEVDAERILRIPLSDHLGDLLLGIKQNPSIFQSDRLIILNGSINLKSGLDGWMVWGIVLIIRFGRNYGECKYLVR
jgi:hypothetical protein